MEDEVHQNYEVLARKYRPGSFYDLIGQDTLVRTLTNAIEANRIAQAFLLTGIRGTGKTSTARIIAKSLNCTGDDNTKPTTTPCGQCSQCNQISQGRHIDTIEIDAASRTGVADIREVIENSRYRPTESRYKVYIIDEVHMLSTSAFNALLKTLEEPPAHVKFILATTEIKKIPPTILSRCQRFDLRRIRAEEMTKMITSVALSEGVKVTPPAAAMIARASEGSARDALSMLDQAMAYSCDNVSDTDIRAMLGITDLGRLLDLLECILKKNPKTTLSLFGDLYDDGAEPSAILKELAELAHLSSVIKVSSDGIDEAYLSDESRGRIQNLLINTSMYDLEQVWNYLLRGLEDIQFSPNEVASAQMSLIKASTPRTGPDVRDFEAFLRAQDSKN